MTLQEIKKQVEQYTLASRNRNLAAREVILAIIKYLNKDYTYFEDDNNFTVIDETHHRLLTIVLNQKIEDGIATAKGILKTDKKIISTIATDGAQLIIFIQGHEEDIHRFDFRNRIRYHDVAVLTSLHLRRYPKFVPPALGECVPSRYNLADDERFLLGVDDEVPLHECMSYEMYLSRTRPKEEALSEDKYKEIKILNRAKILNTSFFAKEDFKYGELFNLYNLFNIYSVDSKKEINEFYWKRLYQLECAEEYPNPIKIFLYSCFAKNLMQQDAYDFLKLSGATDLQLKDIKNASKKYSKIPNF